MKLSLAPSSVRCDLVRVLRSGIRIQLIAPVTRMTVGISGARGLVTGVEEALYPVYCTTTKDWSEVEFSWEEQ